MADFTKNTVADMAAANPGINMGTTGSLHDVDWGTEGLGFSEADDAHWRSNYHTRPYAVADRGYEHYRPAYRYGATSAGRYEGREWDDVESELERGWDSARGHSQSAWADLKGAARDAWDRARGRR
jgi:hypothetical protein